MTEPSSRRPFFYLPYAVAKAIDLGSRARYAGAPEGSDARVEASRGRGSRSFSVSVHCGRDVPPLMISDIERVAAKATDDRFRADCAEAINAIRAAVADATEPIGPAGGGYRTPGMDKHAD